MIIGGYAHDLGNLHIPGIIRDYLRVNKLNMGL